MAYVDVSVLHAALDEARLAKGLSWRELARQLGLSPSTMTRLGNKRSPDVNAFMIMVRWLNMRAEDFLTDRDEATQVREESEEPELGAQLAPLLRARKDLAPEQVEHLQDLIRVAARGFKMRRAAEPRPE